MRVLLQRDRLILVPEAESEKAELADWKTTHPGFAFVLVDDQGAA
jgi:hypothetical protein